ncbi:MAG TPA: SDR family oxidoreductase [Solimonas sp.]
MQRSWHTCGALVTGASRGIGRAVARRLAAQGLRVVVTASERSRDGLDETVRQIVEAGGRARSLCCDLVDAAARADLIAHAAGEGAIDVLINNAAGISAYAPPSRIDLDARRRMLELNLQAPVDLIQQALPAMQAQGFGRIVNIGSEMANQPPAPYPGPAKLVHALGYYGVSKAALHRYTEALAAELHGSGVCINAVLPYKIVATESAADVVRQTAAVHPDWIEPVEVMAEAVWQLIASGSTGVIGVSRQILQSAQAPVHALDGVTRLGDALMTQRSTP